jgi:hypothetical protein
MRPVDEAAAVADLGRRGITPVIRVRGGGNGHISVAGLACYRPGDRSRLIYRLYCYRGRKGETRAFTWTEYRDLLIAAHRQLPGRAIVLVRDNLNVHLRAELRAFTDAQAWLRVFRLPRLRPRPQPCRRDLVRPQARRARQPRHRQLRSPHPGHPARLEEDPVPAGLIESCLAGTG